MGPWEGSAGRGYGFRPMGWGPRLGVVVQGPQVRPATSGPVGSWWPQAWRDAGLGPWGQADEVGVAVGMEGCDLEAVGSDR